jgi:4,4'-diaponeurosporenoate glycosyltransferase
MILFAALIGWLTGFVLLWKVPTCGSFSASPITSGGLCIIIPARNEEATLPRLLKSIADQDFRPQQVIVVDDDSTDRTAELAAQQ